MAHAIGIDVGGTFTDAVYISEGRVHTRKFPTHPERFSEGILGALERLAEDRNQSVSELLSGCHRFVLGTTAVTNALAALSGERVGLLTTRGFESLVAGRKGARVSKDGFLDLPVLPLRDEHTAGIAERIDRDGKIVEPLDLAQTDAAIDRLVTEKGVRTLAVSLLWSFKNPTHEHAVRDRIRARHPDLPVFLGSELVALPGEYERTTAAILNAYVSASAAGIVELEAELQDAGLTAPVLLLQGSGGAIPIGSIHANPLSLVSSGPAAGVVAAADVAESSGFQKAVCCDMGGTSIDVAVVSDGQIQRRQTSDMGGIRVAMPSVDVDSIGAGGGSVAWIDAREVLRVGPRSARAFPGPACYGRGGEEATVTDALVALGYIGADGFAEGTIDLDVEAARAACGRLGKELGLSWPETAHGIRDLTLSHMRRVLRAKVAENALDPAETCLISFGGSGSLVAPEVSLSLGLDATIVPPAASVLSAVGAAITPIRRERQRAIGELLDLCTSLESTAADLTERVLAEFGGDGLGDPVVHLEVDLRFARQTAALAIPFEPGLVKEALRDRFVSAYRRLYGEGSLVLQTPIEVSVVRAIGVLEGDRSQEPETMARNETRPETSRRAIVDRAGRSQEVTVYPSGRLEAGVAIPGPAIIDLGNTSAWVPDGANAVADARGSILIRSSGGSHV